jgi:MtfA peptidase
MMLLFLFLLFPLLALICIIAAAIMSNGNYRYKVPFIYMRTPLPAKYKQTLENHFRFYQNLSPVQKKEFERRVHNFIRNKKFIPMHGMKKVTPEMKSLISASAIQLTFGLREIYFVHFDRILVFPTRFFSIVTEAHHIGEVNADGIIAFSWKDFVKGYINPDDSYNVGLHEMAHALSLENLIPNQEYQFLDQEALKNWKIVADMEFQKAKNGNESFLRRYAFSNRDEFFPVCIEYFFERPGEFYQESPELYKALSALLRQDPLNNEAKAA